MRLKKSDSKDWKPVTLKPWLPEVENIIFFLYNLGLGTGDMSYEKESS